MVLVFFREASEFIKTRTKKKKYTQVLPKQIWNDNIVPYILRIYNRFSLAEAILFWLFNNFHEPNLNNVPI